MNYKQDVSIDETALDYEWLSQPQLMMEYGQYQAECRKKLDEAKEELLVIDADLEKDIRNDPERYELDKLTEKAIHSTIILQDEHKKAMKAVIDAQYEYEMSRAAVNAFEHRKQALENLSRLLGLQYFSGPKMPRDLPKEVRDKKEKELSNKTISIKRKRRK